MATQVFTIPGTPLLANVEAHSPGATLIAAVNSINVKLTDPLSMWGSTVGNITKWGIQHSTDNGVTWTWKLWQHDLPFGQLDRHGVFNVSLTIFDGGLQGDVGHQLRLAILVDTNITLGATITVA